MATILMFMQRKSVASALNMEIRHRRMEDELGAPVVEVKVANSVSTLAHLTLPTLPCPQHPHLPITPFICSPIIL